MGQSASQAHAFYRDVARTRRLWSCRDEVGIPQPKTSFGDRAQPFWSSLSRVQKIIKTVPAYGGFVPYELTWDEFLKVWVPDLKASGVKVGVNWSGKGAVGYDMVPDDVVANVCHYIAELAAESPDAEPVNGLPSQ
jgi:hypothetical protein